ncbi:MAG TPA: glucose-6-phosphate dehydrogenase [Chloroflexota bacterium]|nr:glucose-6-phosphate dehydrogenase [Chloroflexota bacterium]
MSTILAATNPLRAGLRTELVAEPCIVVIFGATGDLTHRKLMPALYSLALDRQLPAGSSLVGFARRPFTDETFREEMLRAASQFSRQQPFRAEFGQRYGEGIRYVQSSFDDPKGYDELKRLCAELDASRATRGNRLFYLATAPTAYPIIIERLGAAGLVQRADGDGTSAGWTRIVVEKPFGRDLATARELNAELARVFQEDQVYRIDHYLGKDTVQNIMAFRFSNSIFESVWNRDHIDHVQITVAESIGVEGRGPYYEESGALRDMVANHMLQVLSLVAMEPPVALDANAVRDEKVKVLRAIQPLNTAEVARRTVRGQYGPGAIDGRAVPGYREEERVEPKSPTETFVALKLSIDNWRWAGVPFYLRHGKRLPKRATEIAISFKPTPQLLFGQRDSGWHQSNVLNLRIQPDEGIGLRFGTKVPGPGMQIRSVLMDFRFGASFGKPAADAYERLILDAMQGESTLFTRRDETEAAWTIITSILDGWQHLPAPDFPNYEAGTWGPRAARDLIARDGRAWARL